MPSMYMTCSLSQDSHYDKCIKIRAIFITTRFTRINARVGILLTCGKHLHDLIVLVRGEVLAHITTLIPTYFIKVPVAIREIQRPCICRTGTAYSSRASELKSGFFQGGFVLFDLQFYTLALYIVVYPFVLFLLSIALSVPRRYADSDYPVGIFKLFLQLKDKIERIKHHYKL